jgi:hypothetical protein
MAEESRLAAEAAAVVTAGEPHPRRPSCCEKDSRLVLAEDPQPEPRSGPDPTEWEEVVDEAPESEGPAAVARPRAHPESSYMLSASLGLVLGALGLSLKGPSSRT